jgi:type II secretory ATPase GspE/PulE/Tfp pilus assembly ATPase PilB-like protein
MAAKTLFERVSLSGYKPLPEGVQQYPLEYIENNSAIKLREMDESVIIGVCDPDNWELLQSLRLFHRKEIDFKQIDRSELAGYLGERLSAQGLDSDKAEFAVSDPLLLDKLASDAPIVNLVNSIMIEAIRKGSSDIHIESFSDDVYVRYRLDGFLKKVQKIDRERFLAISTRIKIMANLNIMERRLPQEGRISVHLGDDIIDVRVSIVPVADGESIVLRLFNKKRELFGLDELGIEEDVLDHFRAVSREADGLILVTGPTGSGKTTTLNSVLRELNSEEVKIITIEDPIEYVISGINQIQTNDRIGLTFESILRRVLRQDPDVIMVGEVRDPQTTELAVRAALTGHLVFSTLHTGDSVSIIPRLRNLGVEPYLISAVLKGVVAQRLVRRICRECKEPVAVTPSQEKLLTHYGLETRTLYRGRGCQACSNTGYRGRIGVFEYFRANKEVEEMIAENREVSIIKHYLVTEGMRTLMADGLQKVFAGVTTLGEIERAVLG